MTVRNTLQGESSHWLDTRRDGALSTSINAKIDYTCAKLLNRACPTLTFEGDKVVRGVPKLATTRVEVKKLGWTEFNALIDKGQHVSAQTVGQLLNIHATTVADLWCTHKIAGQRIGDRTAYTARSVARLMLERHNDKTNPYQMNDEQRRFANRHGGGHGRPAKDAGRAALCSD